MKILTVNAGSSSVKYKLFEMPKGTLISRGIIERIGEPQSKVKDHAQAIKLMFDELKSILKDLKEIGGIGHRVVHGGEDYKNPVIIDKKVLKVIEKNIELAPLHNPANLAGIKACLKYLPQVKQVAVFDTAFHQTLPEYAFIYAIPYQYYEKYKLRKYGFHGTSHQYVAMRASKILKKPLSKLKLITCHLGNGASITAIKNGRSVDTSMGFTPLEGLVMGTRCGDIDPAIIFYLMEKENLSPQQVYELLNKKSGLLGVSKISNDVRVLKSERKKKKLADLSLKIFLYRIKKYIGAYISVLGGADAIIFTAGIGENNPDLVKEVTKDLGKFLKKKPKILIIPTDEEKMIAYLTYKLLLSKGKRKKEVKK